MSEPPVDADAFNAFEAAVWENQVVGYEDFFGPITSRLAGPLLDAAEVGRDTRVLDVATGPGHIAASAAERGAFVLGVDIAEGMISLARRLHPQLDFLCGDAEGLPFADRSFNAVVARGENGFVLAHPALCGRVVAWTARWDRPTLRDDPPAAAGCAAADTRGVRSNRSAIPGRRRAGASGVGETRLRPQAAVRSISTTAACRRPAALVLARPGGVPAVSMSGRRVELIIARNLVSSLELAAFIVDDEGVVRFFNDSAG